MNLESALELVHSHGYADKAKFENNRKESEDINKDPTNDKTHTNHHRKSYSDMRKYRKKRKIVAKYGKQRKHSEIFGNSRNLSSGGNIQFSKRGVVR